MNELIIENERSPKYRKLFRAAVEALKAEDKTLRDALDCGQAETRGYTDAAHGLTYWLFETTLVYVIFRVWVKMDRVAWEYAVGSTTSPSNAYNAGRGATPKCDLMLLSDDNQPLAAFEAKWWNGPRSNGGLMKDVGKLQQMCKGLDKFLLTFWWGTDTTMQQDFEDAATFCKQNSLKLRFIDTFGTRLVGEKDGYFALGVIWVP